MNIKLRVALEVVGASVGIVILFLIVPLSLIPYIGVLAILYLVVFLIWTVWKLRVYILKMKKS